MCMRIFRAWAQANALFRFVMSLTTWFIHPFEIMGRLWM